MLGHRSITSCATVKEIVFQLVQDALKAIAPELALPPMQIDNTKSPEHGDLACNVAMALSKLLGKNPRELAAQIVQQLPAHAAVAKVEIAGPGFINFFFRAESKTAVLAQALTQQDRYGSSDFGKALKLTVEYVSANPTGPLHVGHGRGAAYGSSLTNILQFVGFDVQREYYVNDYGRQMDIMTTSLWLRYLEAAGIAVRFPENAYKGGYVTDMAAPLRAEFGARFERPAEVIVANVPPDESQGGDKDKHIDALIGNAKAALGAAAFRQVYDFALVRLQAEIKAELERFNVHHDHWFSERTLAESGALDAVVEALKQAGHMETRDGALWFKASEFGDEKDRVVLRENSQSTYFASDIAYLKNKFERGFDQAIYVLGADHHGYIARLKAGASGLGIDPNRVEIDLVQFARLFKDGEEVAMGKREGKFVTLADLRNEVGTDAARFFYVMRSHEQHLDFDLELAKKQSADNPVYYVQYAHARICRVFERLSERGLTAFDVNEGLANVHLLAEPREQSLMLRLTRFVEMLQLAAAARAPHMVANYLRELAAELHGLYDSPPRVEILATDTHLRNARLCLMRATAQVLKNGLSLLGVSAPERM
jgi:arginyl-tRNA synthetase